MAKAALFGINYAPEPSGNAPYTTALAEHLARTGWDVDVHTGVPHYPQWRRLDAPSHEVINGVNVFRHKHYVPSQSSTLGRGLLEASWSTTIAPAMARTNADIVVGVVPTLSGAYAALGAARRSHAPCVVWIQDLLGQAAGQSGVSGGARVAGAVSTAELAVAKRADRVLVAADGFRSHLISNGVKPDRIRLVRNWTHVPHADVDRDSARNQFGFEPGSLVAVHSGNMGFKQDLHLVLRSAHVAPDVTFVLQGDGSVRDELVAAAKDQALDNVTFLPSLDSDDLVALLTAADVLLLTQRPSVTDMSLPSKLTTYLSVGTPIAASVNPKSEAAILLEEADTGFFAEQENIDSFVATIRTAAQHQANAVDTASLFGSPQAIEQILEETMSGQ